jgi:hypothetical protein
MEAFSRGNVGCASRFRRFVCAKMDCLSVCTYSCAKVFAFGLGADTCWKFASGGIRASSVLYVFRVRDFSKVTPAVVRGCSIDVVDFQRGFLAGHQFPHDAMLEKLPSAKVDVAVGFAFFGAYAGQGAGSLTSVSFVPTKPGAYGRAKEVLKRSLFPGQFTSMGIVADALAQIRLVWHALLSHVGLSLGSLVRAASALTTLMWPVCDYADAVPGEQAA